MNNPNIIDKKLWNSIKEEAKIKFLVFPNAYASFWMTNQYKKRGGRYIENTYDKNGLLKRWKDEKWVNICEKDEKGNYTPCGRKIANLNKKDYPLCRPSIRINEKTPKTIKEISEEERISMCKKKKSMAQGVKGKPVRVFFSKKDKNKL